jgi:hypothetical protein
MIKNARGARLDFIGTPQELLPTLAKYLCEHRFF